MRGLVPARGWRRAGGTGGVRSGLARDAAAPLSPNHLHLPTPPAPAPLAQLYPEFYCRYEDPSYLKRIKIELLIAIADPTNAYEIAEEMTQVGRVRVCGPVSVVCWGAPSWEMGRQSGEAPCRRGQVWTQRGWGAHLPLERTPAPPLTT